MATNPMRTSNFRSISLPSRSHPLVINVEDHLQRLRATEATSSTSSLCHTFDGLKKLYETVNDMLQLPLTQQTLSHESNKKCLEEVLDGSLRLLDTCSRTKDALLLMKDSVQEFESSLRRRGAGSDLENAIGSYMVTRKMVNKMVFKSIKNLKSFEKICPSMLLDKDSNLVAITRVLREVEAISLPIMKSLLCYISGTGTSLNKKGWSLISNIVQPKHLSCNTEEVSQLDRIDSLLITLDKQKSSKDTKLVQNMMKQLETSELAIQELEDGLESVFRCLLKTRVTLLNTINQ